MDGSYLVFLLPDFVIGIVEKKNLRLQNSIENVPSFTEFYGSPFAVFVFGFTIFHVETNKRFFIFYKTKPTRVKLSKN